MAVARCSVGSAGAALFRGGSGGGGAILPPVGGTPASTIMMYFLLVLSLACCSVGAGSSELHRVGPVLQSNHESLVEAATGGATTGGDRRDQRTAGRALESFPTVANSTVMFLHVFKCAGTSLREVFMAWAKRGGWQGAVVQYCKTISFKNEHCICLNEKNDLVDPLRQRWLVKGKRVLAGHFFWDFRHYVTAPYLMVTTLRNPLELFVSGQQFKHKADTKTLNESVPFVSDAMRTCIAREEPTDLGFIRRFSDTEIANSYRARKVYPKETMLAWVQSAVDHLETFYVVGVVEQYQGFIEVLKRQLDPDMEYPEVWKTAVVVNDNGFMTLPFSCGTRGVARFFQLKTTAISARCRLITRKYPSRRTRQFYRTFCSEHFILAIHVQERHCRCCLP
ncbi:unnamed protein product [Pylaiella littoralis]